MYMWYEDDVHMTFLCDMIAREFGVYSQVLMMALYHSSQEPRC